MARGKPWTVEDERQLRQLLTEKKSIRSIAKILDKNWGIKCPHCGGTKVWKAGKRYMESEAPVQRHFCVDCCYRFSKK